MLSCRTIDDILKKYLAVFVVLISTTFSFIHPSYAAVKAGSTCTKYKANATINGKKYTCIKNGKRLIWNSGIVLSKPTPTPSLTLSTTPTPAPVATNTVTYKKISAYEKVEEFILKNPSSSINTNIYISEEAKKRNYKAYLTGLEGITSAWIPLLKNPNISIVLFTEKDSEWIDKKQSELMGAYLNNPSQQLQSFRIKQSGCNIGGFYLPGIIVFCVKSDADLVNPGSNFSALHAFAHEYTHFVAMTSTEFTQTPVGSEQRLKPCWFEEGVATFYGVALAYSHDKQNVDGRIDFVRQFSWGYDSRNGLRYGSFIDILQNASLEEIVKMMSDLEVNMNTCRNVSDAYMLGLFATEFLVDNYGVETLVQFVADAPSSNSWKTAFVKNFGITPNDFYIKFTPYLKQKIAEFDIIK